MDKVHETANEKKVTGELGIIALESCKELGQRIDKYILEWRKERGEALPAASEADATKKGDSYLIPIATPRFGTGEAKGQIFGSVRGEDLYILVDVCNFSITYKISGVENRMSPDDHYQDVKRIISAIGGKARRITVIMPFLYESRQHKRSGRESLDCAIALQELISMGVDSIITFDAHEPRVQNAIPLNGFETYQSTYQFIKGLHKAAPDIQADPAKLMVVSPDENGMRRSVYMANVLGVDMGMFFRRIDYTQVTYGRKPPSTSEYLGPDPEGRDVILLDDLISSGKTALALAKLLKEKKARRIFVCATFGLFTNGLDGFDKAYEKGYINAVLTTNLIYQSPALLSKPYYYNCDMAKYLALIIDTMNHDGSVSSLLDPFPRINYFKEKYDL